MPSFIKALIVAVAIFPIAAMSGDIVARYNGLSNSFDAAVQVGDYGDAIGFAEQQLEMDPSDPEAFLRLATAVRLAENGEKAVLLLEYGLRQVAESDEMDLRSKSTARALLNDAIRVCKNK